MSAEPALLAAIRAHPDDDTPRLAYADWLDESGDPARAEFVRVQVELARLPDGDPARPALEDREHDLLATHEPAWLGVPPDALTEWEWDRGFVNEVASPPEELSPLISDLLTRHPVRRWSVGLGDNMLSRMHPVIDRWETVEALDFSGCYGSFAELGWFLARYPFAHLRELDVSRFHDVGSLALAFARFPGVTRLEVLRLHGHEVLEPNAIDPRTLAGTLSRTRLRELAVARCEFTPPHLAPVFASQFAATLSRLDLSDTNLNPGTRPAFNYPLPNLVTLDLTATPLAAFALEPLLASPALAGLRELNVNRCGSAANVVRALLRSPFWTQATALRLADGTVPTRLIEPLFAADGPPALRTLDLSNNFLYDSGVADLCNATWAGGLTWLGLGRNYLTDDAAERIARSGQFRHLRTLHLSYNHPRWLDEDFAGQVTDRGAVALATSPGLATLRVLTLTGVSLTAAGVDALINSPFWRLSGLGLGRCDLTTAAVRVLAASPRLARLSFLDLSGNPRLRGDALLPLAESPYLSPLLELDVHGCGAADGVREELRRRLGRRFGG